MKPPPLHVAFFNRSYYPDTAATGQLLTELCESLVRDHGCRVSVVAGVPLLPAAREVGASFSSGVTPDLKVGPTVGQPKGWIVRREQQAGVDIFRARGTRFSKRRFIGRFTNYVSYFASASLAGLQLDRPDVIVALTDPPIIGLAAWIASRRYRVPFVMSFRDVFPEVARLLEDFQAESVNAVLQQVNRFLVRRADRVIALGDSMRRRLIEGKGADADKTLVIPDWADCDAIVPAPKRNPFSEAHGLADKFVVMHAGNLGLSQNLEAVVRSAEHLRDLPDLVFAFVGEGVKKAALEAIARERDLMNVRFLPYQPQAELGNVFGAADCFVVSLREGLSGFIVPSKLYAILASGRPYVAAMERDSEAVRIAEHDGCGLVARVGDSEDLAARIRTLYLNRDLAPRMGQRARKAGLRFDRRVGVAAYAGLLRSLVYGEKHVELGSVRHMAKRMFDIVLAAVGLAVSLPLWAAIAIAIRLEDDGPVFFRQDRVGLSGRVFKALKFRSMIPDAEAATGPVQADADDPRVTRVGRILRSTAMDELPQLWNILIGDMSFVGPRPLRPGEIDAGADGRVVALSEIPGYDRRHSVRPGLTGLAQVYAPRDVTRVDKFRLDLEYLDRADAWLDLRLLLLSLWITVRGEWERRDRGWLRRSL